MKTINITNLFGNGNIKRVCTLILAILMLTLSACQSAEPQKNPSNTSTPSSSNAQNNATSDDSNVSETTDSEENKSFTVGDLSIEGQNTSNTIPSDANEIKPVVDPANLMTNYKGYAEKERNKRLSEILNTPNTLNLYDVKGDIYYVSTSGSDSNDGLTPETAIRSLSAVDGLPLKDGDAVLFERGCIWRMTEALDCRSNTTYGSYGTGRKPMFLGSPKNFAQEIWKPSKKKNVWQISYLYNYPCGAFFDQGKEAGYLKTSMRSLTANTHFFYDESIATLYLYCDKGNPSDVWDSIEFSQAGTKILLPTGAHNIIVDNIAVRYTGQGGIGCPYGGHDFTITNCEIGFAGGAWYGGVNSGLRYCNGIESWCGGTNLTLNHNWIYQTFDSAISPQGTTGENYTNVSMSYNLLEFNNCDLESWEKGTIPGKYSNYIMDNNICRFTSLGWGTREDDGGIRGIDGVHYGALRASQIAGKFSFSNNIIDCPGRMLYKFTTANKDSFDKFIRKNNVYYIKQSLRTTTALTYQFQWRDEDTLVGGHSATNEKQTIEALADFEPLSKVYWYK